MNGPVSTIAGEGVALLVAGLAMVSWLPRWRSLAGTTLRAPWYWTLAALAWVVAGEVCTHSETAHHLRYLAAVATFCPTVAVLGAKRPQDRAWQFIVLSLFMVLALPDLQQFFSRPPATLELHAAWRWFLVILIVVGLANGLPTRYWPSSVLAALGQTCMLAVHLPIIAGQEAFHSDGWHRVGVMGWCLSVILLGWDLPRRRKVSSASDLLWLDFRDLVGAMWAMRVAERMNAASNAHQWKAELKWHGWDTETQLNAPLQRSFCMLLRRFVSAEWIARRLSAGNNLGSSSVLNL